MDTATKTGIDDAKTASTRVVKKTAKATGDLIGNIIADKITSIGKPKENRKTPKEIEEIYIPPEKRQKIIDDHIGTILQKWNLKKLQIFSRQPLMIKIYQDLLRKTGSKFMINQEEITMLIKKLESKNQC